MLRKTDWTAGQWAVIQRLMLDGISEATAADIQRSMGLTLRDYARALRAARSAEHPPEEIAIWPILSGLAR